MSQGSFKKKLSIFLIIASKFKVKSRYYYSEELKIVEKKNKSSTTFLTFFSKM